MSMAVTFAWPFCVTIVLRRSEKSANNCAASFFAKPFTCSCVNICRSFLLRNRGNTLASVACDMETTTCNLISYIGCYAANVKSATVAQDAECFINKRGGLVNGELRKFAADIDFPE